MSTYWNEYVYRRCHCCILAVSLQQQRWCGSGKIDAWTRLSHLGIRTSVSHLTTRAFRNRRREVLITWYGRVFIDDIQTSSKNKCDTTFVILVLGSLLNICDNINPSTTHLISFPHHCHIFSLFDQGHGRYFRNGLSLPLNFVSGNSGILSFHYSTSLSHQHQIP